MSQDHASVADNEHGHAHGHGHGHRHGHRRGHGRGRRLWAKVTHVVVPHSHDANHSIQLAEEAQAHGIRAAWIGLAGMMATAGMQLAIVAISGSIALLADTLHNIGHAVTTIPLVVAFRIGRRAATRRYSYGYRRAEDLVGLLIGLVIAVSAAVIIWESVDALVDPRPLTNLWWVFVAGVVGFVGNELVAVYRIRVGRRIGSAALVAEGQHARADGLTSIAVVLGVIGVWLGFERADAVMGLLIAAAILWILVTSARTVFRRLMDGVEPGVIEAMTATARSVPGVVAVDRVRARWTGHRMEADANISIRGDMSLLEGHDVAERVEHELLHATPHLDSVVVHLHPMVDGAHPPALHNLSGHHASVEAREAYRRRLTAGAQL